MRIFNAEAPTRQASTTPSKVSGEAPAQAPPTALPRTADPSTASARRALRAPFYLVCIRGPDTGRVCPVPVTLGRSAGFCDPQLSRHHARLSIPAPTLGSTPAPRPRYRFGHSLRIEDLHSRNGTRWRCGVWSRRVPAGSQSILFPCARILAGKDVFVIRPRPPHVRWVKAGTRRFTPFIFLPFISIAFLAIFHLRTSWSAERSSAGAIAGVAICVAVCAFAVFFVLFFTLRSRRERDIGRLALVLAMLAAAPDVDGGASTPRVKPSVFPRFSSGVRIALPGGSPRRKLHLGTPDTFLSLACVGAGGDALASWIAAALTARLGGAYVTLPQGQRLIFGRPSVRIDIIGASHDATHSPTSPINNEDLPLCRIAVARSIADVPEWCEVTLFAKNLHLTPTWWDQFGASDPAAQLPAHLDLAPLLAKHCAPTSDGSTLAVPIGQSTSGVATVDLVADGPHALIAGTTGSGKSEALLTWLRALSATYSPQDVRFILIDYKGGASFHPLASLPHTEAVFTDLGPDGTLRALRGIAALLHQREAEYARLGVSDYAARRARHPATPHPRIIVVVDEFTSLIESHPQALPILSRVCAQGRSLGMHLIASTQRPAGVIPGAMRQNLDLRVGLRCVTESDSVDLVGSPAAAHLERIPGRAVIPGVGLVQCALSTNAPTPYAKGQAPALPWAPHFPTSISVGDLHAYCAADEHRPRIALLDGIEDGAHQALTWAGADIVLRTDPDEAPLCAQAATSLGHILSDALAHPLVTFDFSRVDALCAVDAAQDCALALEAASTSPHVLVFPDFGELHALLTSTYGPLHAAQILDSALLAARAHGSVCVRALSYERSADASASFTPLLNGNAQVFTRSHDIHATFHTGAGFLSGAGTSPHSTRPTAEHHWWLQRAGAAPRLACLPISAHTGLASESNAYRRDLVTSWASALTRTSGASTPQILCGGHWTALPSDTPGPWLILGDRTRAAQRALTAFTQGRSYAPPTLENLNASSWSRIIRDEDSQLLILNPTIDVLQALAHASIPLPLSLHHRSASPMRGIARVNGQWLRAGIAPNSDPG